MEFNAGLIQQLIVPTIFMASLGILLALLLSLANRYLFVYEDPRIDEVEDLLPHANCGACGTPGCRPFAEALVAQEVDPGLCTVNAAEMNQHIADFHTKKISNMLIHLCSIYGT